MNEDPVPVSLEGFGLEDLRLEGVRLHPRAECVHALHIGLSAGPDEDDVRMSQLDGRVEVPGVEELINPAERVNRTLFGEWHLAEYPAWSGRVGQPRRARRAASSSSSVNVSTRATLPSSLKIQMENDSISISIPLPAPRALSR